MGRVKNLFLEFLSFDSHRARAINLALILFILRIVPLALWENGPSICIFKRFIIPAFYRGACPVDGLFAECNCPGCGLTRGIAYLLRGNVDVAWAYNPLTILVYPLMLLVAGISAYRWLKK